MRNKPGLWVLAVCAWSLLGACGPDMSGTANDPSTGGNEVSSPAPSTPDAPDPTATTPTPSTDPQSPGAVDSPSTDPQDSSSSVLSGAAKFQPAFHQALRWSKSVGSLTTFRMRIPVGRAGQRVRVTFRSGDGSLTLHKATIAHAGPNGALASEPLQLTFNGSSGFTVGSRKR